MAAVGYWDRQYNPRLSVTDAAEYFERWSRRAAEARSARPPIELAYGTHARERLDLFRAPGAKGTLVFIHGGYWRAFGKQDVSWMATPFVAAGLTVAVLGYPLCPEVSLARIGDAISSAMDYLTSSVLTADEQRRIALAGHSAGGHLAASYQASGAGRPADAVVCVSGLFDLLPLQKTEMLATLNFNAAELHDASPLFKAVPASGAVLLAVGAEEPAEFHWQSARLATAWGARQPEVLCLPGCNHFSAIEALGDSTQRLFQQTLRYFA